MVKRKNLVIVDNGHGVETPGKRSPDGLFREYLWCRRAARKLVEALTEAGIDSVLLVPEDRDVSLRERCRRAAALSSGRKAVLVSIHNNASGDGSRWGQARGWSAFVAPRASAESKRLAASLHTLAVSAGLDGNRKTPPVGYWTAGFAICRDTPCPAVLTENLFQDNRDDVAFLMSEEGIATIVGIHAEGLKQYFS